VVLGARAVRVGPQGLHRRLVTEHEGQSRNARAGGDVGGSASRVTVSAPTRLASLTPSGTNWRWRRWSRWMT
jgi:hypothetical protein